MAAEGSEFGVVKGLAYGNKSLTFDQDQITAAMQFVKDNNKFFCSGVTFDSNPNALGKQQKNKLFNYLDGNRKTLEKVDFQPSGYSYTVDINGSSFSEYSHKFSGSFSCSGSYSGFSASLKSNYSQMSHCTSESSYGTHLERCEVVQVNQPGRPQDYLLDVVVQDFKTHAEENTMWKFFDTYGLYYCNNIMYGGVLSISTMSNSQTNSSSSSLSLEASASYLKMASAGVELGVQDCSNDSNEFNQIIVEGYGGDPTKFQTNDRSHWNASILVNPLPVSCALIPVYELAPEDLRAIYKTSWEQYCLSKRKNFGQRVVLKSATSETNVIAPAKAEQGQNMLIFNYDSSNHSQVWLWDETFFFNSFEPSLVIDTHTFEQNNRPWLWPMNATEAQQWTYVEDQIRAAKNQMCLTRLFIGGFVNSIFIGSQTDALDTKWDILVQVVICQMHNDVLCYLTLVTDDDELTKDSYDLKFRQWSKDESKQVWYQNRKTGQFFSAKDIAYSLTPVDVDDISEGTQICLAKSKSDAPDKYNDFDYQEDSQYIYRTMHDDPNHIGQDLTLTYDWDTNQLQMAWLNSNTPLSKVPKEQRFLVQQYYGTAE